MCLGLLSHCRDCKSKSSVDSILFCLVLDRGSLKPNRKVCVYAYFADIGPLP